MWYKKVLIGIAIIPFIIPLMIVLLPIMTLYMIGDTVIMICE